MSYTPQPSPSDLDPSQVVNGVQALHPMPWTYMTAPTGAVLVIDATRRVVNLFALCDLAVAVSRVMSKPSDPYNQSVPTDQKAS